MASNKYSSVGISVDNKIKAELEFFKIWFYYFQFVIRGYSQKKNLLIVK